MRRILDPLVGFVAWHRRAIGALLAVAAALLLAHGLAAGPPSARVVVLTADVAAGDPVAQVELLDVPIGALPDDALTSLEAVGDRPAAVPLTAGTVLQPGLLGRGATRRGTVVVPVLVTDDSVRSALRPGDVVSLIAPGEGGAEVVASGARVASLPAAGDTGAVSLSTGGSDAVLVEVSDEVAATIAMLGQSGQLSLVLGSL